MIALHVGIQFKGKIRQCITKDILRMHWIETKHKIRIATTKVEEDDAKDGNAGGLRVSVLLIVVENKGN